MPRYSPLLTLMIRAAEKSARALRRDFVELEKLQVLSKGPADFVTAADRRSESILVQELRKARPNYRFLAEEGGEYGGSDSSNRWIIDPIDGTTNFIRGIPHWAISIALERDGELEAGVIFDVPKNEIYVTERGSGAFMNHQRLRVSGRKELADCVLALGTPSCGNDTPHHEDFMGHLKRIMPLTAGTRRNGACSLDLAYVAAGRFDGYWERGIKPWDMAAGILLVREAGGKVTDLNGGQDMFASQTLLAGPAKIHEKIHAVFRA